MSSDAPSINDTTDPSRTSRARLWGTWAAVSALAVALAAVTADFLRNRFGHSPSQLFEQARSAFSAGRLDEAEAILARLAQRRTPKIAERLLRAEVARLRGRIDLAVSALDGYSGPDTDSALIWRTRGMLEIERDRARAAESALLHALALNPRLAEARRDLINLYTLQSRRSDLSAQFRALALAQPLSFEELYLWCLFRRLDVGPADLAAKLERMLRNDPEDRMTRLALAENLRRIGRLGDAAAAVTLLPSTDPDARAARARLALDRGEVAAAASLLAEGPVDHPALARLRGHLALSQGNGTAVAHYRAALAGDPDDRDALFGLGQALRAAGKLEDAQPYLQGARARDQLDLLIENARSLSRRNDPGVLQAIGEKCRSLGRVSQARAWYRLALSHDPADSDLQRRLFELDAAIENAKRQAG